MADKIPDAEAAVYDRQIRLWGVEAQKRIRSSHVLFWGFRGLNAEICKNMVLGGVSATVHDNEAVQEEDLGANFFLKPEDVGKARAAAGIPRAQELNPLVTVASLDKPLAELTAADLAPFTLVCAADVPYAEAATLDGLCREAGIALFWAASCGFSSFMFCDLGPEREVLTQVVGAEDDSGEKKVQYKSKTVSYCTLAEATSASNLKALSERYRVRKRRKTATRNTSLFAMELAAAVLLLPHLAAGAADPGAALDAVLAGSGLDADAAAALVRREQVLEHAAMLGGRVEISPVCAVVGGIIGQELFKAISGKGDPINNFFFFDGRTGDGVIRTLAAA